MAASQPITAEPFEDGNTVVRISTTSASATNYNHPGLSAVTDRSGWFTDADLTSVCALTSRQQSSACLAALRQIRSVRRSLSRQLKTP